MLKTATHDMTNTSGGFAPSDWPRTNEDCGKFRTTGDRAFSRATALCELLAMTDSADSFRGCLFHIGGEDSFEHHPNPVIPTS